MGNGFKRFIDTSPLSLKSLNDQLEQIWLKVMGGIRLKDLDSTTRTVIEGKVNEEDMMSIIEQSSNEILLAVGRPGGDNLIKNGNAIFVTDGWIVSSSYSTDEGFYIMTGSMIQQGIRLMGGKKYTMSLEVKGSAGVNLTLMGQYAGQPATADSHELLKKAITGTGIYVQHKFVVEVPASVYSCYLKLESAGASWVRRIYLREGENVNEFTTNPNELNGNGISISDEGVSITASRFNLDVKDEEGRVKTVLNADGAGFTTLAATNINIGERDYYSETGTVDIYVNSESGNDKFPGISTYYPLKTIAKALKLVPLHIRGTYNIHLSGGTYIEDIFFNYGGTGRLNILGESAVLHGGISISACNYNLIIQSLKIFSRGTYCVYGIGRNGFLTMTSCLMDCNGLSGSRGLYMTEGFRGYIRQCEINNTKQAIYATRGAQLDIVNCKGNINANSIIVSDMAIINVEGTVPFGNVVTQELDGGRIEGFLMAGVVGSDYTNPRDAIKTASYSPTAKFTYSGTKFINGRVIQGMGNRGMVVFNRAAIASNLSGKVIKSVKMTVKRRDDDSLSHDAILRVYAHNNATMGSGYGYTEEYGEMCKVRRGEEVSFLLPLTFVSRLIAGTATGLMFFDTSYTKAYHFELSSTFAMKLEVMYV